ncbi:outer membrane beta-barrel protein [Chitinophaga solisilvae]|uniref:outer membrane beta-barrel protein n=1 Tax=Chitinophaga solisilvae TaxID=1233460 RepID=UPI00136ABAF3|nr:outer membrane beta-barrel protein [Chitinophaga solisilvae]
MRYKGLLLLIIFCNVYTVLKAQKTIKGTVFQKETRQPLPGASVMLYTEKSILKAQTISDEHGHFTLEHMPEGFFRLIVSFMGNRAEMIPVEITPKTTILTFDYIQLAASIKLNKIEIKGSRPLLSIRKDTIEFEAGQLRTAPSATMQHLIEKIPGISIDENGNIFFMGKPVKDLHVDGRAVTQEGGSTKRILEILKSDMADKIQIADKRNFSSAANPGESGKVLNITIKKEMKKGVRGSVAAGIGRNDRFNAGANANMFRTTHMVIADAIGNNTNTSRDPSTVSESPFMFSNQKGINKTYNFQVNAGGDFRKKLKASVFLSHQAIDNNSNEKLDRENILNNQTNFYTSNSTQDLHKDATTGFMIMDYQIHPRHKLNIIASLGRDKLVKNDQQQYQTLDGKGKMLNAGLLNTTDSSINLSYATTVNYQYKFNKPGRMAEFYAMILQNSMHGDQVNYNRNYTAANNTTDTLNRLIRPESNTTTVSAVVQYKEPVKNLFTLGILYGINHSHTSNQRTTFDFDNPKRQYIIPNDSLSYDFTNDNTTNTVRPVLELAKDKINFTASLDIAFLRITSNNLTTGEHYYYNNMNIGRNAMLTYKFNEFKSLLVSYNGVNEIPSPASFWPQVNISNPLYIQLGNPDLQPGFSNRLEVNYNSLSITGLNFAASIQGQLTDNAIANAINTDSTGKQVSRPVNLDGQQAWRGEITLGKRFKKPEISLTYRSIIRQQHNINLVNNNRNTTDNLTFTHILTSSFLYKSLFELTGTVGMDYNSNKYSLQPDSHYDYLRYNLFFSLNTFLPFNVSSGAAVNFIANTDARQQFTLLNLWVSKSFLRQKNLMAKLYAYDVLRQNKSITTTIGDTFRETIQANNLSRYFMFSITYFYGKKQPAKPGFSPL